MAILLKVQVKIIFFKKTYLKAKFHLILNVFASVCPKLALKMHTSHGVWLLWLVLVPLCFPFRFSQSTLWMISLGVCVGLCLLCVGPLSACSAPMVLARSLGKCFWLVCLAFSSFMLGSLWAIPLGILTCQTPCVICIDFIGRGHGIQAPNFPKRFPHQILHAQPPCQKNENLAFLCLGGGWLRIDIV